MAKAAASLLPGLLPTPPTKPCLIILPASFASNPKPGRADSVERWDAHKKDKKPTSPASSCSSSSSPGRASSCQRWDINKHISGSSCTSSSSSRQSSTSSGGASPCGRWDSNKQLPPSRTTPADRWDTHKKPLPAQASAEIWTSDKDKEQEDDKTATVLKSTTPHIGPMFSGPSVLASPDPSMLPMPTFFRSRNPGVLTVQAF
ncbi:hypothetical protein VPH35_094245 [Triticum aestivum]|uniref:Uncharacterized protein n=1 Tax=Triticum turgidum subsp. durum TaxID=4567 RepID=A0A9R1AU11_TRITD|nr:unnamed protein product [Triticum turgidum subsp. durum]